MDITKKSFYIIILYIKKIETNLKNYIQKYNNNKNGKKLCWW